MKTERKIDHLFINTFWRTATFLSVGQFTLIFLYSTSHGQELTMSEFNARRICFETSVGKHLKYMNLWRELNLLNWQSDQWLLFSQENLFDPVNICHHWFIKLAVISSELLIPSLSNKMIIHLHFRCWRIFCWISLTTIWLLGGFGHRPTFTNGTSLGSSGYSLF